MVEDGFSDGGDLYGTICAFKDDDAELFFQLFDLAAEGGLGHKATFGSPPEVPCFSDRENVPEIS